LSVYDIARQEDKTIDVNSAAPVGIILDLEKQTTGFINGLDVMNTFSTYVTRIQGKINKSMIALTKALALNTTLNVVKSKEELRDNAIDSMVDAIWVNKGVKVPKFLRNTKLNKVTIDQELIRITDILDKNPHRIRIEKEIDGSYTYTSDLLEGQYSDSTMDNMLEALGIPVNDRLLHKIALEYNKRYSVDNVEHVDTMIEYFTTMLRTLPNDFGRTEALNAILKKYKKLKKQFNARLFRYTPRVYKADVAVELIENQAREKITKEVEDRTELLNNVIAAGEKLNQSETDWLARDRTEVIEEQVTDEVARYSRDYISTNNYSNYVHSWQLNRTLEDNEGLWIKDDLAVHDVHNRQFWDMIMNDVLFTDWLLYEYEAKT
ncbi:hypothetical protein LCGC14_2945050, partial [marine sediment metagenome]